jgi:hypothetical protein
MPKFDFCPKRMWYLFRKAQELQDILSLATRVIRSMPTVAAWYVSSPQYTSNTLAMPNLLYR